MSANLASLITYTLAANRRTRMLVLYLLVVLAITWLALLSFRKLLEFQRARRLTADLPCWSTLPLIGNAHHFFGGAKVLFRRVVEMSKIAEENGGVFKAWFGPKLCLLLSNPEDVKAVSNAFIEKPYYYTFGKIWLGDGLVTAPGAIWKKSIKKISGTFTGSIVDGFQDIFNRQAQKLTEKLKGEVGRPPFDVLKDYLALSTLESICQSALGHPDISGTVVTADYYNSFQRACELLLKRGLNIFLHPDFIYRLTSDYRELRQCVTTLHHVSKTVIANRRKERNKMKENKRKPYENGTGKSSFKTVLEVLLELSDEDPTVTDEWLQAEVDTVIVGGQETTATTLLFTLLMLGCHKEVQDKVYDEIKSIFGNNGRAVDKEDLPKLRYCEAVILETLRMYPPFPGVMREADSELRLEKFTVPKGAFCAINAWGTGRSSHVWGPDADTFRPERWLGEQTVHPAGFLAFSYGRRSCIGKKYAMAIVKTVLVHTVRELVFKSEAEKLQFRIDIVLRPICGHLMEVQLRE